jgi:type IV secretory pathway VirB2 component (pilin)
MAVAAVLAAVALGFLIAAVHLGWERVVPPVGAALLTALTSLFVAMLLLLVARPPRRRASSRLGMEAMLLSLLSERSRPMALTLTAFGAGLLAGLFPRRRR